MLEGLNPSMVRDVIADSAQELVLRISVLEARNELLQKALENEIAGCGQCQGTGFFDIDQQGKAQCVKCYNARKALAAAEGK